MAASKRQFVQYKAEGMDLKHMLADWALHHSYVMAAILNIYNILLKQRREAL